MKYPRLLYFLIMLIGAPLNLTPVFPGTVRLKNGDRITGTVSSLSREKLKVETAYAGDLSIDWNEVEAFSSEEILMVEFTDKRSFQGRLELDPDGRILVRLPEGTKTLTRSELTGFEPPPRPEDYKLWQNWHGDLKLGLNISRGNTDLSTISFIADPSRVTAADRINLRYTSLQSREEGRQLGAIYRVSGRYDRFFSERKFVFAQGRFERDDKASLEYRYREGGGLGFDLLSSSETALAVTGGFFFSQERFTAEPIHKGAEGSFGIELDTRFFSPVELTSRGEFNPVVSENRFFLQWATGISLPLFANLRFGFEFLDSYDSDPATDVKQNDLQFISTLSWGF